MTHLVRILSKEPVTHDVIRITAEKPDGLDYKPGQAADVSIPRPGWQDETRPFTFTSLPEEDHIEFTIKTYPLRHGVTEQLLHLQKGSRILVHDVFGDIHYQGPGIFIAGGAGVTPFIAIMKQLKKSGTLAHNKLIFANKTRADIIDEAWFRQLLGDDFINILSEEEAEGYQQGHVSAALIKNYQDEYSRYFYVCGPDPMIAAVEKELSSLGITEDRIVREGF